MDRNLALEFVRVTESAAIAASEWIGKGNGKAADGAAVDEMRDRFNQIDFKAEVVIGEGEKDQAPMLFTHEIVGLQKGKPTMDLAVDPLEATDSVAHGTYNALSVIVAAPKDTLMQAPDTYMQKIAVGPLAKDVINLDASTKTNIRSVAKALKKKPSDVTVLVLDRPRHETLIVDIRQTGARVRLITDGDVAGAIAPSLPDSGIDMLMGIGASAEAVLASAAIKILGGEILCRFVPKDEKDRKHILQEGAKLDYVYSTADLTKGNDMTFTATGVIDGPLLRGVVTNGHIITTHSLVMRGQSGTIRYITTHHHQTYDKKRI
ncbi:MAG TPA: class II fructose-bisphosphatase [Patescibacteria group bacterium]|nr:class II fructose-bisphosphatase [Patescibacteria group bacterium]